MIFNVVGGGGAMTGFKESADHPGCYYRTVNGETEWLNPPMVLGEEYRTTERAENKPVYTMRLNCGIPTLNKSVSVSHGIINEKMIRSAANTGDGQTIPISFNNRQVVVDVYASSQSIYIYTNSTLFTDKNITTQLWYTKN